MVQFENILLTLKAIVTYVFFFTFTFVYEFWLLTSDPTP